MQVKLLSDQQLIARYLEGDENAFEILLNRHKDKIYTSIYLFVKDQMLAEDIFQEVFIKIIDTLRQGKYNHEANFANGPCVYHITCAWTISVVPKEDRPFLQPILLTSSMYWNRQMIMRNR